MFWANHPETGLKIQASPGASGVCPMCGEAVRSKCGDIMVWHFAHKTFTSCDLWSENESRWHLDWKLCVPQHMREYVVKRDVLTPSGSETWIHRADILNSRGTVIELQHSEIQKSQIKEREQFYINMIWIFDVSAILDNFTFKRSDEHHTFVWRWPRKYFRAVTSPLFLDFGKGQLFLVKKLSHTSPGNGHGHWINKKDFKKIYFV